MKTFTFEGKVHEFAEEINPKQDGLYTDTSTYKNIERCYNWFVNGDLNRIVELD